MSQKKNEAEQKPAVEKTDAALTGKTALKTGVDFDEISEDQLQEISGACGTTRGTSYQTLN